MNSSLNVESQEVVLGYHGNLQHLEAMKWNVTSALEDFARSRTVRLIAVYDVEGLGKWRVGRPRGIEVVDKQWSQSAVANMLENADIGLVPHLLRPRRPLIPDWARRWQTSFGLNQRAYNSKDYQLRFKFSTNLNRIYPFIRWGVPVISDLTPSGSQVIDHGRTGFLAHNSQSWFFALDQLSRSSQIRAAVGALAHQNWPKKFDPQSIAGSCVDYLEALMEARRQGKRL